MSKLKRQIISYFILCVFGSSVVESMVQSLFDDSLFPQFTTDAAMTKILIILHFSLIIVVFVIFACIFYCLADKAIQKESKRQLIERNMLYSCITHDLKTPMTSVQGFAAALKEGKVKPDEQREIYDIIYNKSCYMNELLDTMFTYTKLTTEDDTLFLRAMDICSLVRGLVALHYDKFENKEMNLHLDIPEEFISCNVDEKEMKRAISNLLINAYKHNEKGVKIMVRVSKQEEIVRIIIADNGRKLTKEEELTIFAPFIKGDDARSSGAGAGLGLAISNLVVEKHGGRLYIDDNIEGYTKGFVINLKKS